MKKYQIYLLYIVAFIIPFLLTSYALADTQTFTNTEYTIEYNNILITNLSGSGDLIIWSMDGDDHTNATLEFQCLNSQCNYPITFDTLEPNKQYLLAEGTSQSLNTPNATEIRAHLRFGDSPNTLTRSELTFQTNADSQIFCWSIATGQPNSIPAYLDCENPITIPEPPEPPTPPPAAIIYTETYLLASTSCDGTTTTICNYYYDLITSTSSDTSNNFPASPFNLFIFFLLSMITTASFAVITKKLLCHYK